jgi:hypothetical protein
VSNAVVEWKEPLLPNSIFDVGTLGSQAMGWPTVELAELPGLEVKDVNAQLANGVRPQLLAALAKRCGVAWRLPNLIGFPRRSGLITNARQKGHRGPAESSLQRCVLRSFFGLTTWNIAVRTSLSRAHTGPCSCASAF